MAKLQAIQNALISINETVFQDLCDSLIYKTIDQRLLFSRTGSQVGKQKTRKGTPDSFVLLENGKYIFVEYSTNVTKGVLKLISDIKKCLDTNKTGVPLEDIEKIILCFNFNVKTNEIQKILDTVKITNIELQLYSLDTISLELSLNHRDLVRDFLGLSFDTGQIVSIDKFIKEYNTSSQSIATPLDNPFIHREEELKDIKNILYNESLVILRGVPGTGKTRLAIETIKNFVADNNSYKAYCISYKSASLIDDLNLYLNTDNDYILFVDDANRIDNIGQIIGFYKQSRRGKLKIIITVRDYAYNTIRKTFAGFSYKDYTIAKFTDEQIIDIVKNKPFNILNSRYHKEIVRIADGNPRLAIMTALLAIEKQDLYALNDVSDLFDSYFSTFVKDNGEFDKTINIKILGLASFFYALPYKDREVLNPILSLFGIDYDIFIEQIDILERLELLVIQYDYIKISEQNVSTFFFYKSFIKDDLLSFETLLSNYFDNNISRFRDCIIPANNNFGYENVIKKIKPTLSRYLETIIEQEERAFSLLSLFWFYLQEETLSFLYKIIENLPKNSCLVYNGNYGANDFAFTENRNIELLGQFFRFQHKLKDSIELAFEFVRRKPEHFAELVHKIRTTLTFSRDDEREGFYRQKILFDILIKGVGNRDVLYTKAFYELSKTFLLFNFEHTESGRNHSIIIYHYLLPFNKSIKEFRKRVWECLNVNFAEDVLAILESYAQPTPDIVKEVLEYDTPFVCSLMENHLVPSIFAHCKYVQDQIRWYKRCKISSPLLEHLSRKYTNPVYELYLKVNWDRCRDKELYEFDNYNEYRNLKETELRNYFVFESIQEIDEFYNKLLFVIDLENEDSDRFSYDLTLDIIVENTFNNNFRLGIYLLKLIIRNNPIGYIPHRVFKEQLVSEGNVKCLWETIQESQYYNHKEKWEISFYHHLPQGFVCREYIPFIIKTVSFWNHTNYIYLDSLERFFEIEPMLLEELLRIIVTKTENGQNVFIQQSSFHNICLKLLETNIELVKKTYLHQDLIQSDFDCKKNILFAILVKEPAFLITYTNYVYKNNTKKHKFGYDSMNLVWQINNIEIILEEVFDIIDKIQPYYINDDYCNSFFCNIPDESKNQAEDFLISYCAKNYDNSNKMNIVVDIARNTFKELYDKIILLFVSLTQDVDLFSKVHWCISDGMYCGDTIIGDIDVANWNHVLSVINHSKLGYKLIPIKKFINTQIEFSLNSADQERKRKFVSKW